MSKSQIFLCIAFAFTGFVSLVTVTTSRSQELVFVQLTVGTVSHSLGLFLAAFSGLALLLKGVAGASLDRLSPLILPLFAGLLLMKVEWSLALPLGLIVVALIVRQMLKKEDASETDRAS